MSKSRTYSQCDSQKLDAFLLGRLSSEDGAAVESHLSECTPCAERIQLAAVPGTSWSEARSMLAQDEYDGLPSMSSASFLFPADAESRDYTPSAEVLSREIRGWLDPTDDPKSLGRFAGYEVTGIVGHGGMGIVLKGVEASLNRFVAIKVLAPRLATNGSARKRFAREAQAAAAVRQDNVIAIHRVDEWHGLPFLVMPYVGGVSLQKRIDAEGPLSIEQTLRVGVQVANGLAAAHAQGLVHRDIKPANILLEHGVERVTITDFGLARAADDASVTRTGVIAGTPQYMSPEQADAKRLDARSDLFSLGSVLYAAATGRPPFRGEGSFEVLKRIVNEPTRPMREIEPTVADWFERLVCRLHAKSPEDRPQSAEEVAALLRGCLAHVQQPDAAPLPDDCLSPGPVTEKGRPMSPGPRRLQRPPARAVRLMVGVAFVFALILAGVVIVLELNKGTLSITSEADNVPIRITIGNEVVKRLSVTRGNNAVRVAAGQYVVEIDGPTDELTVANERVTLRRGQHEVVEIIKKVKPAEQIAEVKNEATLDSDVERLQGVWTMAACDSEAEKLGDTQQVVRHWRWIIRDNEVLWSRSRGEVWKMKLSVNPTKAPKEIDLTFLDGPHKDKKSLGVFRWGGIDGKMLEMSVQDPGAKVARPKSISMRSGEQTSLIFLEPLDLDKELASLQGTWKFEIIQTEDWPKPIGKGPDRLGRGDQRQWVIKGNEIAWTSREGERIKLSFTIDPTKPQREIDVTFLSGPHKGEKCLGIYRRGGVGGVVLWFCLTDPGSHAPRPKDISVSTGEGRTMIGLTRIALADAPENRSAPADGGPGPR